MATGGSQCFTTKQIVCLANSRMFGSGRCVAGREMIDGSFGQWIRPVSDGPTPALSVEVIQFGGGGVPRILDVIEVPLLRHVPERHQQENHAINAKHSWRLAGRVTFDDIQNAVEDAGGPLWLNGFSSTGGRNDRVPEGEAVRLTHSLYLVRPEGLSLEVVTEGGDQQQPKHRVRANFQLCGHSYRLVVTDPWIERRLLSGYPVEGLEGALVCVSLGRIFHGFAYKLVASVITPDREIMNDTLYTIGHSTHTAEKVIHLLQCHGVTAVADVRSLPYSRVSPHFNREEFALRLNSAGIAYVFLGEELGARPKDRSCYENGKVQYDRLARTPLFETGLERILRGMKSHTIALMCAEKDPITCHRAILVCRHLLKRGVRIAHILEDGSLESQEEAVSRLLRELELPEYDLFQSREEMIEAAYARRGQQIAFVESG